MALLYYIYRTYRGELRWGSSGSDHKLTDVGYSQKPLFHSADDIDASEGVELFQNLNIHIFNMSSNLYLL